MPQSEYNKLVSKQRKCGCSDFRSGVETLRLLSLRRGCIHYRANREPIRALAEASDEFRAGISRIA